MPTIDLKALKVPLFFLGIASLAIFSYLALSGDFHHDVNEGTVTPATTCPPNEHLVYFYDGYVCLPDVCQADEYRDEYGFCIDKPTVTVTTKQVVTLTATQPSGSVTTITQVASITATVHVPEFPIIIRAFFAVGGLLLGGTMVRRLRRRPLCS